MKDIRKSCSIVLIAIMVLVGIGYPVVLLQAQVPDAPAVATMKGVGYGDAFAYESITVADTAKSLTAATYTTGVKKAFITLETAQIRWRIDGTAPTSAEGHLLETTQSLTLNGYSQIVLFKAIRTGSSGTIKVTYLK
jgi:hypothetical protein